MTNLCYNKFCEKYEVALWIAVAALWFYVSYFTDAHIDSILGSAVFWTVMSIFEFVRIYLKGRQDEKSTKNTSSKKQNS